MIRPRCLFVLIFVLLINQLVIVTFCRKQEGSDKPDWAKKKITDYSEADLERLLEQWEEDDEPLEPDELPEHLRPMPNIDVNTLDKNNPEELVKLTKKGRTLMTFVKVTGNPNKEETEKLTKLWQSALWNNHIQAERYLVDDDRAIFLFKDGSQAWDAKDFLIEQEGLESITIESKVYPGKNLKGASVGLNDEL